VTPPVQDRLGERAGGHMAEDPLGKSYQALLEGNQRFVEDTLARDPNYFKDLAKGQQPHTLWIGCADSRVPANQITGTRPGDIFVHRNIANVVVHTDTNMLSVLQYAVEVLEVPHVIVCGHYGCGGVLAAITNKSYGIIDTWLRNIKDVYRFHEKDLAELADDEAVGRRMVELNVMEQVQHLCETAIIQRAWKKRKAPHVHGWVYDLADGRVKELGSALTNSEMLDAVYRYDFDA
jgi:carbonic anhydrase